eukprot:366444-Chlamydomonas_euryale.AAC.20
MPLTSEIVCHACGVHLKLHVCMYMWAWIDAGWMWWKVGMVDCLWLRAAGQVHWQGPHGDLSDTVGRCTSCLAHVGHVVLDISHAISVACSACFDAVERGEMKQLCAGWHSGLERSMWLLAGLIP